MESGVTRILCIISGASSKPVHGGKSRVSKDASVMSAGESVVRSLLASALSFLVFLVACSGATSSQTGSGGGVAYIPTGLPAVSFLKASAYQDGHAGFSDPLDEQRFIVDTANAIEHSKFWLNTVISVFYDDSDGWYDHVMHLVNGSGTGEIWSPPKNGRLDSTVKNKVLTLAGTDGGEQPCN
jgi:Phosphoesterase family